MIVGDQMHGHRFRLEEFYQSLGSSRFARRRAAAKDNQRHFADLQKRKERETMTFVQLIFFICSSMKIELERKTKIQS